MSVPYFFSSSGDEDDGFEERGVSEGRSDIKRRLYTILDKQSLRRVQVLLPPRLML